jgi:hypothetical protein
LKKKKATKLQLSLQPRTKSVIIEKKRATKLQLSLQPRTMSVIIEKKKSYQASNELAATNQDFEN